MRSAHTSLRIVTRCLGVHLLLLVAGALATASAAPVLGFHERWNDGGLGGWGGGDAYSNPGTGGVFGEGDGFLRLSTAGPEPVFTTFLGTQNSGAAYAGDWTAAGITKVRLWLRDIGNADPLEVHFALGDAASGNFWQYNVGFLPVTGQWTQFTVDLTQASAFTKILGVPGGDFALALHNVNRVLIRHDHAPFGQAPDGIAADLGVDELLLTQGTADVPVSQAGEALRLAAPYPNPSRGAVSFAFDAAANDHVTLEVVDAAGRVVRREARVLAAAGRGQWTWDGRTGAGAKAAPGIYRVRARGLAGGTSRTFVMLGPSR